MKNIQIVGLVMLIMNSLNGYTQRSISEGTVTYDIAIQTKGGDAKATSSLNGAKTIIYLKGGLSRTEMTSALGIETTIYNSKSGDAAILKEYSGQKLMVTLTKENWAARNQKFDGIVFQNTSATKVIEGYTCKQASTTLKDGSILSVYYTTDLITLNKDYNLAFKNLPGFPLEYEFETGKLIFKYSSPKIDFAPVPIAKFDFPKAGYRIMTYDENKGAKKED